MGYAEAESRLIQHQFLLKKKSLYISDKRIPPVRLTCGSGPILACVVTDV